MSFPSQGQGHATTAAQIVADRLGVPIESVHVVQPDTSIAPPGTGTFASRGAIAQGGAVDGAAKTVRAELVAIAAAALEASPADLELIGGRVSVRGVPGAAFPCLSRCGSRTLRRRARADARAWSDGVLTRRSHFRRRPRGSVESNPRRVGNGARDALCDWGPPQPLIG